MSTSNVKSLMKFSDILDLVCLLAGSAANEEAFIVDNF